MCAQLRVSGIVLAGGRSRRLGRDKAVEPIAGEPLIHRVMARLAQVTTQVVVVVADERRGAELNLPDPIKIVIDIFPGGGSLGGIFTGLSAADEDWGIVVACDMPFLNLELLSHMLTVRDGYDAVVPMLENRPEPTHAIYSKVCLSYMERRLQANDLKISRFFDEMRVMYLSQSTLEQKDPDHLSFFNVNTQEDLDHARSLVAGGY